MRRAEFLQIMYAAMIITLGAFTDHTTAGLVGPTPYLQASDSPFAPFTFDFFHLENFEDNLFNVPGVTKSAGNIIGPGLAADSVDGDDGSVDGSGNGGRSLFVVGSSLTFTFDPVALGKLPTHAGIVRTDGGSTASFEAFGPGMISLGTIGPVPFGDGNPNGGTAEDRFFGWSDPNGILAIQVLPSGVFEVDHLQYGVAIIVPEPGSFALVATLAAVIFLFDCRRACRAAIAVSFWLAMSSLPASAAQSFFMGLGDLAGGTFSSGANGVSDDGSVVVGSGNSASGSEAFRWTQSSGMVGLGDLAGGPFSSSASGVSTDGSVVVGSSAVETVSNHGEPPLGTLYRAFRWTQGTGMVSQGLLSNANDTTSFARSISANGSVLVGMSGVHPFREVASGQAFRRTQGSAMVGLGVLSGYDYSDAWGVSANSSVVVGRSWSGAHVFIGGEAFRWAQGSGMVGLGDLPGGSTNSRAYGVSADGSVIVGQGTSAAGAEAFRWTQNGGMVGLGVLPGAQMSLAQDVTADGSLVVGYSGANFTTSGVACLWDSAHGMRSLRDVLVDNFGLGDSLAGWTLTAANDISADGQFIVGSGINPSGSAEAWFARVGPEPALPGDFNSDGTVNAFDYIVWRNGLGTLYTQSDYNVWRAHFGQTAGSGSAFRSAEPLSANVPEPASAFLAAFAAIAFFVTLRRRVHFPHLSAFGFIVVSIILLATANRVHAAMYSVTNVAGLTSAIDAANQNAEPDTIALAAGTTFTLTGVNNSTHGATGLPTITASDNLLILGNGGVIERSTVAGTPLFRLFDVAAQASLVLENLTLQGGVTDLISPNGGAVYNAGTMTLTNVTVQNNVAKGRVGASCLVPCGNYPGGPGWPGWGGGIYSVGSIQLENSVLRNNRAEGGRGGLGGGGRGRGGDGAGAGLYASAGSATLHGSSVTDNVAQGGSGSPSGSGYGGGIYISNAHVELDEFTLAHVTGNTASTNYSNIYGSYNLVPNSNPLPGDYNADGNVDSQDYVVWRNGLGTIYTQDDYNTWRSHFGTFLGPGSGSALPSAEPQSAVVPEPGSALLLILGTVAGKWRGRQIAPRVSETRSRAR